MRLVGHTLRYDGEPFTDPSCPECRRRGWHTQGVYWVGAGWLTGRFDRTGHGYCRCGALGKHEDTAAARKRWHRQHKADVAANVP